MVALVFLSVRLGRVEIFPTPGYMLRANFDSIAGLKTGDMVEIAGVKVGKTTDIKLKDNRAQVTMRINDGVAIDSEAIASVVTSGLIGDKYVSIQLGAGDDLKNGQTIRQTQSAVVLENLIGAFINNSGGSSSKTGASGSGGSTSSTPNPGPAGSPSGTPDGSDSKDK